MSALSTNPFTEPPTHSAPPASPELCAAPTSSRAAAVTPVFPADVFPADVCPGDVFPVDHEPLSVVDALLRQPAEVLARIEAGEGSVRLGRALAMTIALGAASFGAALGAYRGGEQIVYGALKLPLVFLLTAALCSPVLSALRTVIEGRADHRRDLLIVLAGLARTGLGLAAFAPVVLFAHAMDAGYHDTILLVIGLAGAAGGLGFASLLRGMRRALPSMAPAVVVVMLGVYALVGAQMAWTLRPWIVRPRTLEVPFVRTLEGSFLESMLTSLSSAQGIYSREAAPLPGTPASSDVTGPADVARAQQVAP